MYIYIYMYTHITHTYTYIWGHKRVAAPAPMSRMTKPSLRTATTPTEHIISSADAIPVGSSKLRHFGRTRCSRQSPMAACLGG